MDDFIISGFLKVAGKKPDCEGTESSPVGSPRQKSFCDRMCGHKKKNTKGKTKKDPDSCINQALRRWKCRCSDEDRSSQIIVAETLLDGLFGVKTAQDAMDDEACELLSAYVAFVRALYLIHQQNHWDAKTYGNHLLFQRLYEEATEMADDAAERAVGLCGELKLDGTEDIIVKKFTTQNKSNAALIQSSLEAEQAFQAAAKKTYETLKEKNMITLGLDDLIMSQAGQGEVHLYLLQQAAKG